MTTHTFSSSYTSWTNVNSSNSISTVTVNNAGSGYSFAPTLSLSAMLTPPSSQSAILKVDNLQGQELLRITRDGTVVWSGSPHQGSQRLVQSLSGMIDIKAVGNRALEQSYLRGLEKCLRQAEQMDYESFINGLREEIEHRTSKLTVGALLDGIE